ncbi:hypothetical protein D7V88_07955 [Corallococcus terminator]|uniref:Uncharacterized protein n=2 Tax=Corallococcus terminator TaxID=2316733 RepID=A0A3A8JA47_9BACT|nr:hypothetical protein D7V88_07955 [Corallococcus terminator]
MEGRLREGPLVPQDMTWGWYLFNDAYTLSPPVPLSQLRTRVTMTWPGRSTSGLRPSTVVADFRY